MIFLWIKALHVIAVIAWMAGLLYLPRLFVYHAQAGAGPLGETFKVMERKLYKFIMNPAMMVAWAAGLHLAVTGGYFHNGWFHAKFLLVVLMTGVHVYDGVLVRAFAADANRFSSRFFRFYNEAPTVLMIGAVVLVIVKPF
jgi:protoporphyrinogen IX oxidase